MSLETAYLFQGMSDATREEAARTAVTESHETGTFLFSAQDAADHLYVLVEGRIRLCVRGTGHLAHIISEPGGAIGWSSMVGHETYTASAECLGPVKVLKFHKDHLIQLLEKDPAAGMSFFRRLAETIGRRLVASYGATLSVQGDRDMKYWG